MQPALYLSDGYLWGMGIWLLAGAVGLLGCLMLRRRWRHQPRRLRIVHACLSLWFVLAALTLPELYCALCYDETDSFSVTNVSQRWYRMHVTTNSAGFRDAQPLPESLPPGTRHLCFAGDSFTFGHGIPRIEDRFSDRIARMLESERPGKFVVSNVALPGLDIRQLADDLLPELLTKHVPIDVLIYVFVPNDIEYFDERTAEYYQHIADERPQFVLFRDTYFYNLMYYRLQRLARPELRDYYAYLSQSYQGEPWQRFERKLDEVRRMCRAHKIELRVVLFPFLQNLDRDDPFAPAHQLLADYCRMHNVPCLDLEPRFRNHTDETLTVNPFDAHPNERAHQIAAAAIRRHLLADLTADE